MANQRQIIIDQLNTFQNRARNQEILNKVTVCLFIEFCILAAIDIAIKLVPFPYRLIEITTSAIGFAVIIVIYLRYRHRGKLTEIATFVDDTLQLKARVNTSLELIQNKQDGEIVDLQIHDSAESIANADPKKVSPYVIPPFAKWIAIPILIMLLSYAIPRQYQLTKPTTAAEQNAIDVAITRLNTQSKNISHSDIRDEIYNTIEQLRKVKDANAAHEHLHALNSKIRKQKQNLPDEAVVTQASQTTKHFKNMDSTALADELNRLSEQPELTPELQAQLAKLFAKLSEDIPQGRLQQTFEKIQTKTVSADTLQQIADALQQVNQLNQLEEQLIDSRKDIALAGVETMQSSGGLASSDSAPGQESGNKETQGTQVISDSSDFTPMKDDGTYTDQNNTTTKQLTGDDTGALQSSEIPLAINLEGLSDGQSANRVFTGNPSNQSTEPAYLPFSDVVLAAQREYAQAIENNRIPVRYRTQIKAYLEAIAKADEK